MTKSEVLTFVQSIKPHSFESDVMLRWLEELEQKIATELHDRFARAEQFSSLTAEQLSVPSPYDRVYWTYLVSMIDFTAGNAEAFALSDSVFREAYAEYARALQRSSSRRRRSSL